MSHQSMDHHSVFFLVTIEHHSRIECQKNYLDRSLEDVQNVSSVPVHPLPST